MALDSVQNKYLEGEGSPNGVVKGKKGFTYKDTLTNDEYSSLGGDKWRKDVLKSTPMTVRKVSNISNDDNELETVEIGEVVFDEQRQVNLKVVRNEPLSYIIQEVDTTNGISSKHIMKDISNNGSPTFAVGTIIKYKLNVERIETTGTSTIMGFNAHYNSLKILKNISVNSYNISPFVAGSISIDVRDIYGKIANKNNLVYNEWYNISITFLTATTVRGPGLDVDNTRGINLVHSLENQTRLKLADIEIRGEKFHIDEVNKTVIGEKGSVFYNRPESLSLSVFGRIQEGTIFNNSLVTSKNMYELKPVNGIITPQMLGYECSKELDFTNDASDILQACFDSPYKVLIPGGLYYISKPLRVRVQKEIELMGNAYTQVLGNNPPAINSIAYNQYLTWLYTDKNIDIINIETSRVIMRGGLIDTSHIPLHDKCAIRLDANYRVAYCQFIDMTVQGNKDTIFITGAGTKAFHTDLDVRPDNNGQGHAYYNKFTRVFGLYTDTVVSISERGEHWQGSNFINTYTIDAQGDGCKRFIDLRDGYSNKITAETQDRDVLNDEENDLFPFYISGGGNIIDVFCFDQNYGGVSGTAPHRHNMSWLYAPNSSNILTGRSLSTVHPSLLKSNSLRGVNNRDILNNPREYYLSDSNNGLISNLNSAIRYAADFGNVTYKGYLAPNLEWFDTNLHTADSVNNSVPLTEDNNGCVVEYPDELLSSKPRTGESSGHLVKNGNLGFAEIHIVLPIAENLLKLTIDLGGGTHRSIQVIQKNEIDVIQTITYTGEGLGNGSFRINVRDTATNTKEIIIRLIGLRSVQDTWVRVFDISAHQKGSNMPVVHIGERRQTKKGSLTSLRGFGDGFEVGSKLTPFINFSENLLDSEGKSINLSKINSHTVFNNTTENTLDVEFNRQLAFFERGVEYFFRVSGNLGNLYPISGKVRLTQTGESMVIIFKDGANNITLSPNEWIKLKVIDKGESANRTFVVFVEIDRSNHKTYRFNQSNNIEDIVTIIPLNNVLGVSSNMTSANTNKTFTTTGNVLNAFAEVLINRVDQPEITGATYKASKGVPFVPSTSMIMRVENKGVPRGIVYWFEEV